MSAQAVLFDAPGPKARRRHAILTVLGLLLAAGIFGAFIWRLYETAQLEPQLWTPFLEGQTWTQYLLPGLWRTLQAALVSVVFAIVFGLIFGMGRLSQARPLRWACGVIVEFFRSVPVLLMMTFLFFFMARNFGMPGQTASFWAVIVGLTLYNG